MARKTSVVLVPLSFFLAWAMCGCSGGTSSFSNTPSQPKAVAVSFNGATTMTVTQGQAVTLSVTVSNDPSGKGVIWNLSGPGTLSKQTNTSAEYDAPATVSTATTATVTATSATDSTKTASETITVMPTALAITPSSLPDGVTGKAYNQTVQVTGGTAPFTWTISAGSLPHNLSLSNSTTSTATISGTPDISQSAVQFTIKVTDSAAQSGTQSYSVNITNPPGPVIGTSSVPSGTANVAYSFTFASTGGVAPVTWSESGALPSGLNLSAAGTLSGTPTATGSFAMNVTATDSLNQRDTKAFTLVIAPAATALTGRYVFQFQGFDSSGMFAVIGSILADGSGNITDASFDTNGAGDPPASHGGLTGTYSTGSDGLTTITLTGGATFVVALNPGAGATSPGGRLVEFNGIKSGAGSVSLQDTSAFTASSIFNEYVLSLTGSTSTLGRTAIVGRLSADGISVFHNGLIDVNEAGAISSASPLSGTFTLPAGSNNGRATATVSTTISGTAVTLHLVLYVKNTNTFFVINNDVASSSVPFLSGYIGRQSSYSIHSLQGPFLLSTTGLSSSGVPDVNLGWLTLSSAPGNSGSYTLAADENSGGTVSSNNISGSYVPEQSGRVTVYTATNVPLYYLYLVDQSSAVAMSADANVSAGAAQLQSAPLSLEGTLAITTRLPAAASQDNDFGTLTFTSGSNSFSGNVNVSSSSTSQTNLAVAGTYSLDASGRGTMTITSGLHGGTSVFYLVGHSQFVLLNSLTAGDTLPVAVDAGCIHFVNSPLGGFTCQ